MAITGCAANADVWIDPARNPSSRDLLTVFVAAQGLLLPRLLCAIPRATVNDGRILAANARDGWHEATVRIIAKSNVSVGSWWRD